MRGAVYFAHLEDLGEKPFLVISNNGRNLHFTDFVVVRITTSLKPESPTRVVLGHEDHPIVGTVLCDEIGVLYEEDITRRLGFLPHATMMKVDSALRMALCL